MLQGMQRPADAFLYTENAKKFHFRNTYICLQMLLVLEISQKDHVEKRLLQNMNGFLYSNVHRFQSNYRSSGSPDLDLKA